jgi:hypothetical protein
MIAHIPYQLYGRYIFLSILVYIAIYLDQHRPKQTRILVVSENQELEAGFEQIFQSQ